MAPAGKKRRILVIDDEPFMRWTIRQMLAEIGITDVHEAGTVKAALEELDRVRPDAVLCDVHLPNGSGLTFLEAMRKLRPPVGTTPVIMVTSDSSVGVVQTAKQHRVDGYLVKPVSIESVRRVLQRVLAPEAEKSS